jgi:protein-L-isoaspartate(D-aspartate) O-methyltransferase
MEPGNWAQALIQFTDWHSAGQAAAEHLLPELAQAQAGGVIERWFFIRKSPCWRLRYAPTAGISRDRIGQLLDDLASRGQITAWTPGIYEPEELAFGGTAAMATAHELFCADSRYVLDYIARSAIAPPGTSRLGVRELGVLLATVLMRAAGQDWYEQGDIWARVARHRQDDSRIPPAARRASLRAAVHQLMTVDADSASPLFTTGPLAPVADWSAAFDYAGQQLADHARCGTLERGLRAVLAHHVLFHWNRLGLPYADQSILSAIARDTGMAEPGTQTDLE